MFHNLVDNRTANLVLSWFKRFILPIASDNGLHLTSGIAQHQECSLSSRQSDNRVDHLVEDGWQIKGGINHIAYLCQSLQTASFVFDVFNRFTKRDERRT